MRLSLNTENLSTKENTPKANPPSQDPSKQNSLLNIALTTLPQLTLLLTKLNLISSLLSLLIFKSLNLADIAKALTQAYYITKIQEVENIMLIKTRPVLRLNIHMLWISLLLCESLIVANITNLVILTICLNLIILFDWSFLDLQFSGLFVVFFVSSSVQMNSMVSLCMGVHFLVKSTLKEISRMQSLIDEAYTQRDKYKHLLEDLNIGVLFHSRSLCFLNAKLQKKILYTKLNTPNGQFFKNDMCFDSSSLYHSETVYENYLSQFYLSTEYTKFPLNRFNVDTNETIDYPQGEQISLQDVIYTEEGKYSHSSLSSRRVIKLGIYQLKGLPNKLFEIVKTPYGFSQADSKSFPMPKRKNTFDFRTANPYRQAAHKSKYYKTLGLDKPVQGDQSGYSSESRESEGGTKEEFFHKALCSECLFMIYDVTELIRHQSELAELKYKNIIMSKMAHELKTPYIAISFFLNKLESNLSKVLSKHNFQCIVTHTIKIQTLADQMLLVMNSISEYVRGLHRVKIINEEIKLIDQVYWSYWVLEGLLEAEDNRQRVKAVLRTPDLDESSMSHFIYNDVNQLRIVLSELLRNAVKYTKDGTITIDYEINETTSIIRISDTGIGFSNDKRIEINETFDVINKETKSIITRRRASNGSKQYASSTKSTKISLFYLKGGVELGLKLVKILCSRMDINLSFSSRKGLGTEFTLEFKNRKDNFKSNILPYELMNSLDREDMITSTKKYHSDSGDLTTDNLIVLKPLRESTIKTLTRLSNQQQNIDEREKNPSPLKLLNEKDRDKLDSPVGKLRAINKENSVSCKSVFTSSMDDSEIELDRKDLITDCLYDKPDEIPEELKESQSVLSKDMLEYNESKLCNKSSNARILGYKQQNKDSSNDFRTGSLSIRNLDSIAWLTNKESTPINPVKTTPILPRRRPTKDLSLRSHTDQGPKSRLLFKTPVRSCGKQSNTFNIPNDKNHLKYNSTNIHRRRTPKRSLSSRINYKNLIEKAIIQYNAKQYKAEQEEKSNDYQNAEIIDLRESLQNEVFQRHSLSPYFPYANAVSGQANQLKTLIGSVQNNETTPLHRHTVKVSPFKAILKNRNTNDDTVNSLTFSPTQKSNLKKTKNSPYKKSITFHKEELKKINVAKKRLQREEKQVQISNLEKEKSPNDEKPKRPIEDSNRTIPSIHKSLTNVSAVVTLSSASLNIEYNPQTVRNQVFCNPIFYTSNEIQRRHFSTQSINNLDEYFGVRHGNRSTRGSLSRSKIRKSLVASHSIDEEVFPEGNVILIVDDDYFCRKSLKNVIKAALGDLNILNVSIAKATDGIDALNMVIEDQKKKNKIKMIISDENMNYINGSDCFMLLNKMFEKGKLNKIQLVVLTALEEEDALLYIKKIAKTNEIMKKPISKYMIKELIQKYFQLEDSWL